jgi:sugar O-acyltransferase (sialic acid O-acetyltransferase NeuD family)
VRLLVVGAGGHAKVVIDAAVALGHTIAAVIGSPGGVSELMGFPVVIDAEAAHAEADAFVVAIGDNRARAEAFATWAATGLPAATIVHPSVVVGSDVELGAGTFVAAGVVINTGARVGDDVILNTGCVVDHDVVIGDHAHVGPRAGLCGAARLGEGVLLGVGASIIPMAAVGDWSVVGAGAAVTEDLPPDSVCVGVPARVVHTASEGAR